MLCLRIYWLIKVTPLKYDHQSKTPLRKMLHGTGKFQKNTVKISHFPKKIPRKSTRESVTVTLGILPQTQKYILSSLLMLLSKLKLFLIDSALSKWCKKKDQKFMKRRNFPQSEKVPERTTDPLKALTLIGWFCLNIWEN